MLIGCRYRFYLKDIAVVFHFPCTVCVAEKAFMLPALNIEQGNDTRPLNEQLKNTILFHVSLLIFLTSLLQHAVCSCLIAARQVRLIGDMCPQSVRNAGVRRRAKLSHSFFSAISLRVPAGVNLSRLRCGSTSTDHHSVR